MNYRDEARQRLASAVRELGSADDTRLRYAALELRMAMEALTYDRVQAYRSELPPSEVGVWQPRKLMAVLLEIDPMADANRTITIGREESFGVQAPSMQVLGSEQVLNADVLRRHYDALGSFLHLPTIKQIDEGVLHDAASLRTRCTELVRLISEALSSTVFNSTAGNFASFSCARCGKTIRKRLPFGSSSVEAECFACHATYTIFREADGEYVSQSRVLPAPCGRDGCDGVVKLWEDQQIAGKWWRCPKCKGRNVLTLTVSPYDPEP